MTAAEAVKYGAFQVDLARPTAYWHNSFSNPDGGHASDTGQRQTAEIIWSAYVAYLHGRTPLPLVVRPSNESFVQVGRIQHFAYATAPHAKVSLKLSFSGGSSLCVDEYFFVVST